MKVTTLLENTTISDRLRREHGLSLYIETQRHRILFDMGASDAFLHNADLLGIDLSAVDIAFLSHGHSDHCGGLADFLRINRTAKVYLQKYAGGEYYSVTPARCVFIGMDPALLEHKARFVPLDGVVTLDEELTVFSGIPGQELLSRANDSLREKRGDAYPPDAFRHEQDLLVTEGSKTALFAGCAHNGIVNILARAEELLGRAPDAVFAGFHLYNPALRESEPRALVDAVGRRLQALENTRYFTGHCTGKDAFDWLREALPGRLEHMSTGTVFTI